MDGSLKQQILDLSSIFPPKDILEIVNTKRPKEKKTTLRYVKKAIWETNRDLSNPKLTLQTYAAAQCNGITKKNDLAAFFGVNRRTINRFENCPEIKAYFADYMELRRNGYNLDSIREQLTHMLTILTIFEPKSKTSDTVRKLAKILEKSNK